MTQTIGQRLKAEREEQRLTLEKVFEATRIRIPYLQALEADDLSVMPSPVQARGYLRNYAEFLGFEVEQVLDQLRITNAHYASPEVVGPADGPSISPKNNDLQLTPASLVSEPLIAVEEKAPAVEQLASSSGVTIPIKPKSGRRKKANGSTDDIKPTSDESTTKRRGRRKVEPALVPVMETPPLVADESAELVEAVPQPEVIEEAGSVAPAEAVVAEKKDVEPDLQPVPDVSDTIWQTWLNRLSSTLSARMKRRTLVPREASVVEEEPLPNPPEVEYIAAAEPQIDLSESAEIFKEIGRELRARRELLSLHFDEVERNTHVKAHYLDALERGALEELSSTVQTRGMLSNYATFLDLDVDALLLRFADALQARHRERNPQKPARKPGQPIVANIPPVRSFIAGDMIFGVGMAILLVGFAIWGVSRVMAIQSEREVKATAPSISDVLLASPDPSFSTATPIYVPVESFPGEPTVTVEIPTQNVNARVQLNLVAVERTYMRVVVDGEVEFDGRVVPGNAYPFEAENQIEVLVGSGAAIRIVYNGRDLGLMGTFGQVVNNIYLGTEIITPTSMPTMTPTITLTPTETALPTATSKLTSTPATPAPLTTPVP